MSSLDLVDLAPLLLHLSVLMNVSTQLTRRKWIKPQLDYGLCVFTCYISSADESLGAMKSLLMNTVIVLISTAVMLQVPLLAEL